LSKKYEVRPYRPWDEEGIVHLLDLSFKGWPNYDLTCSSLDHWKWKFEDNPLKMFLIVVGIHNNKKISCLHEIPLKIKIGDKFELCNYAANLAVHPDFRKIGVSNKMIELMIELRKKAGIQYVYFVSRNPIVIKSLSKRYYRFPKTVLNLVKIRDLDLQLQKMPIKNAWLMKMGFYSARLINDVRNIILSRARDRDLRISEIDHFDERIDEFWEEVSSHYDFIVERNRNYLNWRYCDTRAGGFVVRQAEEDGKVMGYSVLKINRYRSDYPVGFVVDLLSLHDRRDVAEDLAMDAVNYFDRNKVNIVNYLVIKDHPNVGVFNRLGFLDSRIKPVILYLGHELNKIKTTSANRVHFSYGDIDSLPTSLQ